MKIILENEEIKEDALPIEPEIMVEAEKVADMLGPKEDNSITNETITEPKTGDTEQLPLNQELSDTEPIISEDPISDIKEQSTNEIPSAPNNDNIPLLLNKLDELTTICKSSRDVFENKFETKILIDDQNKKIIDKLHKELQTYKDDMFAKIFKPLLLEIIQLKEDMHKTYTNFETKDETQISKEEILKLIENYTLDFSDILERFDVSIYSCEQNEYVPIKQKIVKIVETDDETINRQICKRLSYGYELNEKVIYPEKVTVYSKNK